MTDDEIIAGIQRRADGWDSESASDRVMEQLLKKHGLPLPEHSGFDPEAIAMQAELFELIERWSDAGEAGRTADVAFIDRQIEGLLAHAIERFSKR